MSTSTFESYFSLSVFFVLFRESLEVAVIISVLLSFISRLDEGSNLEEDLKNNEKDTISNPANANANDDTATTTPATAGTTAATTTKGTAILRRMVWLGTLAAFLIVFIVGAVLIYIWYKYARNLFEESEDLIEGILMLIAAVFLTATGLMFAKGHDIHDRMEKKLSAKFSQSTTETDIQVKDEITDTQSAISTLKSPNATTLFFIIPFLSVLRDGLESVLLFAGVGLSAPPSSIPLAAISGILLGLLLGLLLTKLNKTLSLRAFFMASAYLLLLMSAGFFVKGVYKLEEHTFIKSQPVSSDEDEAPLSINRSNLIWYIPSTNPETHLGYGVLNTLLGYDSVATVATITSYCMYWVTVVAVLALLKVVGRRKESQLKGGKD